VAPAGTTHYVHDIFGVTPKACLRHDVIAETDGTGPAGVLAKPSSAWMREYIWLAETEIAPTMGSRTTVDRPLAVIDAVSTSPVTWFVHVDHLNRPVKMTDGSKAVVWSAVWTPWGAPQTITGSATLNARFPGQWFQAEAGLHYNWHRHYDPTLGRYTQTDPLEFVDGPSVYAYVGGSPQTYVDPDGQWMRAFLRKLGIEIDGPDLKLLRSGRGRICQIRYKHYFVRLDHDSYTPNVKSSPPFFMSTLEVVGRVTRITTSGFGPGSRL